MESPSLPVNDCVDATVSRPDSAWVTFEQSHAPHGTDVQMDTPFHATANAGLGDVLPNGVETPTRSPIDTDSGSSRANLRLNNYQSLALPSVAEHKDASAWGVVENATEKCCSLTAVSEDGQSLTYGAMYATACKMYHGLINDAGVCTSDRIGVMLGNSFMFIVLQFAVCRLGAVSVSLNPKLTTHELLLVLEDCTAKTVITSRPRFSTLLHALCEHCHVRDQHIRKLCTQSVGMVARSASECQDNNASLEMKFQSLPTCVSSSTASDASQLTTGLQHAQHGVSVERGATPFQMLYTSGTSGRPKGVLHSNAAVITHAYSVAELLQLTPGDVWMHVAPMHHAMDLFAVFAVTMLGGLQVRLPGLFWIFVHHFREQNTPMSTECSFRSVCF